MQTPDKIVEALRVVDINKLYAKIYSPQDWSGTQEYNLSVEWNDVLAAVKDINVPSWVSVEEHLPKFGEKVIVSDGVHTWDYGMFQGLCGKDVARDKWYWKRSTCRTVKWWMPKQAALPEPPKEE